MSFSIVNFDKLSSEANTNVRKIYAYLNASDTIATISAADYFLDVYSYLSIGDEIFIYGSNGYSTLVVTASSSSTVTTAALTSVPADSITNNEINSAAAIAYSKLAALTSGNILVGSAGNVATSVTMSGDATMVAAGTLTIANNAITSAKLAETTLKYTSVAISAAEFNGMYAAPKLLVAAGGANTLIVLKQAQLLMTYNSAAYAAGGTAAIQYDSTINGAGVIASTTLANTLFQGTVSIGLNMNPGVVTETFTTCVNKGLYLSNISAAYTTGNSTFVMHVWYSVIPTT